MKIKKISLTSLSNREMDRKEKSILSGGQDKYCACATVCWANCACTYIELYAAKDFMGQAAHLETYDAAAHDLESNRIDKEANTVYIK